MSRPRLIALLLAFATLLIYLPALRCDFVNFDDQVYVTENSHVLAGLTRDSIQWAFVSFHGANWHPVTWLSHMLDCELFGLNPAAHHFMNVLIHSANGALLFLLLRRLTNAPWPSGLVAALFAWHPLHVESVAWISERKDVLSTLFALLTLLSYAKWSKNESRESSASTAIPALVPRLSSPDYFFALLFFALGLMSKPMLVTLPFILLLLDFWPLKRVAGDKWQVTDVLRLVVEKIPFFLLTAISCAIAYVAQQRGEAVMTLEQLSFGLRLENALIAYARYLLDTIWPVNLAVLYPLPSHLHWIHAAAATATAVLFVLTWLAWRARNRCAYITVGWLWFLGTLVPVIGLVKVGSMALADRYTYFPLVGIFIAVAFGAQDLAGRFRFLKIYFPAMAIAILIACVAVTEHQLQFWRSSETLFRRALAVTPDNGNAHINLGAALETSGHQADALREYREAVRLAEDNANAHFNIANLLLKMGRTTEALPEFRRAVTLAPATAQSHSGLGATLAGLGKFDEALQEFDEAERLDAQFPWTHMERAKVFFQLDRDAEAVDELRIAYRFEPDNFQILAGIAHYLAANENAAARDGKFAWLLALKANERSGHNQPMVFDVLGMAYAENGDYTNAITCAQNALDLAAAQKLKGTEPISRRLELYKKNQPWRESFKATNAPAKP